LKKSAKMLGSLNNRVLYMLYRFLLPLFALSILLLPIPTFGQEDTTNAHLPSLPTVSLTPSSPFYFFTRVTEAIGDFLTFDASAKARRESLKGYTRIAEVQKMLQADDIDRSGIQVALDRLKAHTLKASTIVTDKKDEGVVPQELAHALDTHSEQHTLLLSDVFKESMHQRASLIAQKKRGLKEKLLQKYLEHADDEAQELETEILALDESQDSYETFLLSLSDDTSDVLENAEDIFEESLSKHEQELESHERHIRRTMKEKTKELREQLREAKKALRFKEKALREQISAALELGDDAEVEDVKDAFFQVDSGEREVKDTLEESLELMEEGERVIRSFLFSKNRDAKDFIISERTYIKKTNQALHTVLSGKEKALKERFAHEKKLVNLRGRHLGQAIIRAREICLKSDEEHNLGRCLSRTAGDVQRELQNNAKMQKDIDINEQSSSEELSLEKDVLDTDTQLRNEEIDVREQFLHQPKKLHEEVQKVRNKKKRHEDIISSKKKNLREEYQEKMSQVEHDLRTGTIEFILQVDDDSSSGYTPEEFLQMKEDLQRELRELRRELQQDQDQEEKDDDSASLGSARDLEQDLRPLTEEEKRKRKQEERERKMKELMDKKEDQPTTEGTDDEKAVIREVLKETLKDEVLRDVIPTLPSPKRTRQTRQERKEAQMKELLKRRGPSRTEGDRADSQKERDLLEKSQEEIERLEQEKENLENYGTRGTQ
jgi:hypothetical protein